MRSFAALALLVSATVLNIAGAIEYTLEVTTCNIPFAQSSNIVNFYLCSGGSDCAVESTPTFSHQFAQGEAYTFTTMDLDVEPTTLVINKPGDDAWCLKQLKWQANDVLAASTILWVDADPGTFANCKDGMLYNFRTNIPEFQYDDVYPCLPEWRFFNLPGTPTFNYELLVDGCDGAQTPVVTAFFCPDINCDTSDVVVQTLENFIDGPTLFPVNVNFNPMAIKFLPYADEWCANDISFEHFSLAVQYPFTVEPAQSRTVGNLQLGG